MPMMVITMTRLVIRNWTTDADIHSRACTHPSMKSFGLRSDDDDDDDDDDEGGLVIRTPLISAPSKVRPITVVWTSTKGAQKNTHDWTLQLDGTIMHGPALMLSVLWQVCPSMR